MFDYPTRLADLITSFDFSEAGKIQTRNRCQAFLDAPDSQPAPADEPQLVLRKRALRALLESVIRTCHHGIAELLPWLFYTNARLPFQTCLEHLQAIVPNAYVSLRGAVFPAHSIRGAFVFSHADFTHADIHQLHDKDQATYAFTFTEGAAPCYAHFSGAQLQTLIATRFYRFVDEVPRPSLDVLQQDPVLQLLKFSCNEAFLPPTQHLVLCDETVIFERLATLLATRSPPHLYALLQWKLRHHQRPSTLTDICNPLREHPSPLYAALHPYQYQATHAIDHWLNERRATRAFHMIRALYIAAMTIGLGLFVMSGQLPRFDLLLGMIFSLLPLFGVSSGTTANLLSSFAGSSLQLLATSYVMAGVEQWGLGIPRDITFFRCMMAASFPLLKIVNTSYVAFYLRCEQRAYSNNPALLSPQSMATRTAIKQSAYVLAYSALPYVGVAITAYAYTRSSSMYRLAAHIPSAFRGMKIGFSLGFLVRHTQQYRRTHTDDAAMKKFLERKLWYWGIEGLLSLFSLLALRFSPATIKLRPAPYDFYESTPATLHPFSSWQLWLFSQTTPDSEYINQDDSVVFYDSFFPYRHNATALPISTAFGVSQGFVALLDTHPLNATLAIAESAWKPDVCALADNVRTDLLSYGDHQCPTTILSGLDHFLPAVNVATPLMHARNVLMMHTARDAHFFVRVPHDAIAHTPHFSTQAREWVDGSLFAIRAIGVEQQRAPAPVIPRRPAPR